MSFAGNLLVGIGVASFIVAAHGNDPFNGMNMALAEPLHIPYPTLQILVNILLFAIIPQALTTKTDTGKNLSFCRDMTFYVADE